MNNVTFLLDLHYYTFIVMRYLGLEKHPDHLIWHVPDETLSLKHVNYLFL